MRTPYLIVALVAIATLLAPGAGAQRKPDNLGTLKQMKVATTDLNIPPVPQTGATPTRSRENLKRVKLPPGFKIELYRRRPGCAAHGGRRRRPTCCSSAPARPPCGR